MLDVLAAERIAAMRAVQDAFVAVELHAHSRTGQRFDLGAEMAQQRLDLAPLDVGADGIVEDVADQVVVLVTHVEVGKGCGPCRTTGTSSPNLNVRTPAGEARRPQRTRTSGETSRCLSKRGPAQVPVRCELERAADMHERRIGERSADELHADRQTRGGK